MNSSIKVITNSFILPSQSAARASKCDKIIPELAGLAHNSLIMLNSINTGLKLNYGPQQSQMPEPDFLKKKEKFGRGGRS